VDAVEEVAELETPEDLLQLRAVGRREDELAGVAVDVEVAPHRRELLRKSRLLRVLRDVLRTRGRQLGAVLHPRLQRPVLPAALDAPSAAPSWPAGLSPIPGTPGMLSEVSPFSPMKSATWSGRTP